MKEITLSVWEDSNKRRILDFIHREITSIDLSEVLKTHLLEEIREPLKSASYIIVAIQGPKMIGYICGNIHETVGTATSIYVMPDVPERSAIVGSLTRELFKLMYTKSKLDVFEFVSPCFGQDYISEPLRMLGFMVTTHDELLCEKPQIEKQTTIEGYTFVSWKPELESDASLVIALSDLGEIDNKRELPEREPRQRWLGEMRETGKIDLTESFMTMRGNRLVGAIIGCSSETQGEVLAISGFSGEDSFDIERKLCELTLQAFVKKGVKLFRCTLPKYRESTLCVFESIGFVKVAILPDALLLSSDDAWGALLDEVSTLTS